MLRYILNIVLVGLTASNVLFAANLDSLLLTANSSYTSGKYDDAVKAYEAILYQGYESDQVYFNLGNAYFKLKNIAAAILNYERAARLNPGDEDISFNLELARTFTVDKIEPLPEFFLKTYIGNLRSAFSSDGWAWLSILFLVLTLVAAGVFWFTFRPAVKRVTFALGLLALLLTIASAGFSAQQKNRIAHHNYGILFPSVVSVKSSPGDSGKDLFILHAGTKVQITKSVGDWVEIRIADGNKGWVLKESVGII